MKHLAFILLGVLSISFTSAQGTLKEKDLIGTWKLVIDMDEVMTELKKESKESETFLEETILRAVSGIVEGVVENIDIYFTFNPDGTAEVSANAFGTDDDEEILEWKIKGNRLYLEDNDHIDIGDNDYWVYDGGILYLENRDKDDKVAVYLKPYN